MIRQGRTRRRMSTMLVTALLMVTLLPATASAGSDSTGADVMVAGTVDSVPRTAVLRGATVTAAPVLRPGMRGSRVRALQQRLVALRYWLGEVDGVYGYLTTQAVMAFQKVNRLPRDGIAGPGTMSALKNPVKPRPRSSGNRVVEINKTTQVVLLVRSGTVKKIFNASTGTASTPTPSGSFRVYRQINGWRRSPLGLLYRPKYFSGGYALHGSTSVPAYPASHGCVRVNLRSMDHLWPRVPIGTRVRIY